MHVRTVYGRCGLSKTACIIHSKLKQCEIYGDWLRLDTSVTVKQRPLRFYGLQQLALTRNLFEKGFSPVPSVPFLLLLTPSSLSPFPCSLEVAPRIQLSDVRSGKERHLQPLDTFPGL